MEINEHTGDSLKSKPTNEKYAANWDKIFGVNRAMREKEKMRLEAIHNEKMEQAKK